MNEKQTEINRKKTNKNELENLMFVFFSYRNCLWNCIYRYSTSSIMVKKEMKEDKTIMNE